MPGRSARVLLAGAAAVAFVGLAYRLQDFGRYGFWNDEAWVAVSTRVQGLSQFRLALGTTPPLWAVLLQPLALAPQPEVSLRFLPLAWSLLTLWLAWRLGTRLAGHRLGGLLALALVALDPVSIQWAKQLKQYSAEAAVLLATLVVAHDVAHDGRRLRWLVVLLTAGVGLSNAQLFVAPPVLAALLASALVRRDPAAVRRLGLATALVGACNLAWYLLAIRPWFTASVREYWATAYVPAADLATTLRFVRTGFEQLLVPGLGPYAVPIALCAFALLLATAHARVAAAALLLLVVELVVLSRLRVVPFGIARTSLFLTTALLVACGAAAGHAAAALWPRRALRPVAALGLVALAVVVGRDRPWTTMAAIHRPENVGPLMRLVEAERQPGDRVLLYHRSAFVWSYYQTRPPVLVPNRNVTVGFVPWLDDPAVIAVSRSTIPRAIERALAGARRVWFVGSRFVGPDESRIVSALAARSTIERIERRSRALLLRATPR